MTATPIPKPARGDARTKLLDAAISVILIKGYAATSVEDICQKARVTKGAFFHHFRSKDDLAVAAANHFSEQAGELYANSPYHAHADPLARVLGYLDFRVALIRGPLPEFTCLIGTMVQETFDTSPTIRATCAASIVGHAEHLEADIAEAMQRYCVGGSWTAHSLALHTQAVVQGAFILAKATGDAELARHSIIHLRRYIALLFDRSHEEREHAGETAQ